MCSSYEGEFTSTARLPVPLNKCDFPFMSWQQFLSTNWILCAIIIATCIWKLIPVSIIKNRKKENLRILKGQKK